jgi:hypothetical protein
MAYGEFWRIRPEHVFEKLGFGHAVALAKRRNGGGGRKA